MRALLIAALLVACTPDEAPSVEPPPTEVAEAPRGPLGAAAPDCAGASNDPDDLARYDAMANAGSLESAIEALEAAVGAHPGSATARVRLGELLIRTQPPRAELAATWFGRALALHEEGCALADRDLWAALEGAGLSRMMGGDYAAARPFFERSLERWPEVRATRYNLACTLCQTDALDGCGAALSRTLSAAGGPPFLGEQRRPAAHYRELARRDPDLAPLRADAERFEAIVQNGAE